MNIVNQMDKRACVKYNPKAIRRKQVPNKCISFKNEHCKLRNRTCSLVDRSLPYCTNIECCDYKENVNDPPLMIVVEY